LSIVGLFLSNALKLDPRGDFHSKVTSVLVGN